VYCCLAVLVVSLFVWAPNVRLWKSKHVNGQPLVHSELETRHPAHCDCGTWQREYTELHTATLKGELPPRFAISLAVEAGLADRLVGTIGAFYFALLTKRAFQITSFDPIPGLELGFEHNASPIQWLRAPIEEPIIKPMKYSMMEALHLTIDPATHQVAPEHNRTKWAYLYLINEHPDKYRIFGQEDLNMQPRGSHLSENIILAMNRGQSGVIFDNPHHKQQLQNWGLTKHTAFTCAWQYLFPVPQQGVAVRAQSISQRLRTSPALKIGLQVRLGDFELARSKAWDEGLAAAYLNAAKRHIDCAEQIEARWATEYPGRPIQWFVISDSRNLRIALKNKYGTKIVTDDESMPQHVDCNNPLSKCKTAKNMQQAAMILAVADIITMSMTDAQIISLQSGFGRIGGWLANCEKKIFQVSMTHKVWNANCSGSFDSIEHLTGNWSGI